MQTEGKEGRREGRKKGREEGRKEGKGRAKRGKEGGSRTKNVLTLKRLEEGEGKTK